MRTVGIISIVYHVFCLLTTRLPTTLLEAIACGLPSLPPMSLVVRGHQPWSTGLLMPPKCPRILSESIQGLCRWTETKDIGNNGRRYEKKIMTGLKSLIVCRSICLCKIIDTIAMTRPGVLMGMKLIKEPNGTFLRERAINSFSLLLLNISYALLQAAQTPAVSYESSIYLSSPPLFVGTILLALISALVILTINTFYWRCRLYSVLSLLLVGISVFSSIILFYIRSYYLYGLFDDPAFHLGATKLIVNTGHLFDTLFYPALHILTTEMYYLTDINIVELSKIIPILFHVFFLGFIAILINTSLNDIGEKMIAFIIGATLFFYGSVFFTSNHLLNMYLPLVIYSYVKLVASPQREWVILPMILLIQAPLFHPLGEIYFLIVLLAFSAHFIISRYQMMFQITCRRLKLSLKEVIKVQRPNANLLLILILTIWSMFWVSRFYIYDYTVKNIYLSTLGSVDKIEFDNHMGKILYADSLGLNLFELFVKNYGGTTLIICLSFIS